MYTPTPLDTSEIELPEDLADLTELLAQNAHDTWAKQRMEEGWSYGPNRDDNEKKHPGLVPYVELSESEKEYDRQMATSTLKLILSLGYRIERAEPS